MTRRALFLFPFAALLRADAARDAWDLVSRAASALAADNAAGFLDCFDPGMEGYARLRADVTAVLREAAVQSSIEPVAQAGDDSARELEVDWILTIVERQNSIASFRREARVRLRVEKRRKGWRITQISPTDLFRPPLSEGNSRQIHAAIAKCGFPAPAQRTHSLAGSEFQTAP